MMNDEHPNSNYSHDFIDFYDSDLDDVSLLDETRYREYTYLAEGAVKKVYTVTDTHCSREVAMAKIKKDIFTVQYALDFVREVQLTSSLEHPNIIRIYDVGICASDSSPWFTMELTSGKTLVDKIDNGSLQLIEKLEIFMQICDAMNYAHENGILHLDLKPSNILLGKHGQILLCDWGISSSILNVPEADLKNAQTMHGYLKGTPGYMAPEQTKTGYKKHPTTDVFSLGAVLHYLLTGADPIGGNSYKENLERTRNGDYSISASPSILPRIFPILNRALAYGQNERYQTVLEFQKDIEQYRTGFATLAEDASIWIQLHLLIKRNKLYSLTFALFVIITGCIGTYHLNSITQSERIAREAQELAESNLQSYLHEQSMKENVNRELSALMVQHNRINLDLTDNNKALKIAKEAVERNPSNKEAQMQLGFTYLTRQSFIQALHHFKIAEEATPKDLLTLVEKYSKRASPLTAEQTIELLSSLKNRLPLELYILQYDMQIKSADEHVKLVMYYVSKLNGIAQVAYKYHPNQKALDLSGTPEILYLNHNILQINKRFNLLSSLELRKLILADTKRNQTLKNKLEKELKCEVVLK